MSEFLQLHVLTSYPPSNLNRDDAGRPKTAIMGGVERLRVSSQSLKRHWRTSDLFQEVLSGHIGERTKKLGKDVYDQLVELGMKDKLALESSVAIAGVFGKNKSDKKEPLVALEIEQLAHISPEERQAVDDLVKLLAEEGRKPEDNELSILSQRQTGVDIALFGRMLASTPKYNIEAACQVAHAISVHGATVEDDYFTAVDDLNTGEIDSGSSHIGETGFAAAVFYLYVCIDKSLLIKNLNNDEALANQAIKALTESIAKISPSGKQNSFASRAFASFMLAERGSQQPRSLSSAFLRPILGQDQNQAAITSLNDAVKKIDLAYGDCADKRYSFDVENEEGTLAELLDFVVT